MQAGSITRSNICLSIVRFRRFEVSVIFKSFSDEQKWQKNAWM